MKKFLGIGFSSLFLSGCDIYSKKIKDWDGLDLIGFVLVTYAIIYFGYQILDAFRDKKKWNLKATTINSLIVYLATKELI